MTGTKVFAGLILAVLLAAAASPVAAQTPDTTIVIRSTGPNLEFAPNRISLRQGTRVRIRYVNEGLLPHNFVLVKSEDDIDALAEAAMTSEKTGYVPTGMSEKMFAWTGLALPGKEVEVTFVVPPPGTYSFVCLYPGHANMMMGSLRALR